MGQSGSTATASAQASRGSSSSSTQSGLPAPARHRNADTDADADLIDDLESDFESGAHSSSAGLSSSLTDRVRAMAGASASTNSFLNGGGGCGGSFNYDSPGTHSPPHSPVDLPSILASAASFTSNPVSFACTPDDRAQSAAAAMVAGLNARRAASAGGGSSAGAGGADAVDGAAALNSSADERPAAASAASSRAVAAAVASRAVLLPTVFHWNQGGHAVYITGAFNNWSAKIPMCRSLNDFTLILDMPPGRYEYRYIVDDEWRYSPDQTVISDAHGNVSNLLIVEPPRAALAAVMRSTRTAAARASASASFDATGTAATGTATGGPHRFTHRASDVCDDNALAQALHAYLEDEIFNSQRDGAGFDDRDSPSAAAAAANQSARAAEYGQAVPDFEGGAYMKDPPILPPHIGSLQHVLLNANAYQDGSSSSSSLSSSMSASSANANSNASSNSTSSSSSGGNPAGGSSNPPPPQPPQRAHIVRDPYVLPAPQTVALHHLFCASHKKDDVRVMAVTQRYKNKFVTTVVYSQNQRGGSGSRVAVPPT